MNPVPLYQFALVVAFPALVAIHGALWTLQSKSYAPAVYGMKLVFIPFLMMAAWYLRKEIIHIGFTKKLAIAVFPLLLVSLTIPFLIGDDLNLFYFFSDFIGIAITISAIVIFYLLISKNIFIFSDVKKTMEYFLIVISIYIPIYYIFSNGDKISVTPEMYIPMAIVIGAYLAPVANEKRPPFWLILLIAFGCAFSQLRENLVIYVLIGAICMIRSLFVPASKQHIALYLVSLLLVGGATPQTQALIFDRIASMKVQADNTGQTRFADSSANQRITEVQLMFDEMKKSPISFITGKGFGAEYENKNGILIYYGAKVHNAHSTPFLVYFRNGVYGLILYIIPAIAAFITLFSRNTMLFRSSMCVLITYAAFVVNQYLYWNIQYGLTIALWLYAFRQSRSVLDTPTPARGDESRHSFQ